MTRSSRPAASACARMTSDSSVFSRQPKVITSGPRMAMRAFTGRHRQQLRVEAPLEAVARRPGHQDPVGLVPGDLEDAAIEHGPRPRARSDRAAPPPPGRRRRRCRRPGSGPAPRSQTRSRIVRRSRTSATPMLARSGNRGSVSSAGPSSASGTASASSTKKTACGLPMLTATGCVERARARARGPACPSAGRAGSRPSRSAAGPCRRCSPGRSRSRSARRPWSRSRPGCRPAPPSSGARPRACRCRRRRPRSRRHCRRA